MELQDLTYQISILSAQFSEFKFWLVAGLALLGVVAAVIVAASSSYIKSHVKDGIIEGAKEAQKAVEKTAEMERTIFLLEQRIAKMEENFLPGQWRDLVITAPTNGPITGFGKCLKTQDGIVMLYIDTYCDSEFSPVATLPEGYRPRRDIDISINAIDVFNQSHPVSIKGHINSQGQVYAHITSEGMQCPINALFIAAD